VNSGRSSLNPQFPTGFVVPNCDPFTATLTPAVGEGLLYSKVLT